MSAFRKSACIVDARFAKASGDSLLPLVGAVAVAAVAVAVLAFAAYKRRH